MVNLLYKTYDDSTPSGKPRVYFCCHAKDFSLYFDTISKDILRFSNCSIWYLENYESERDADFFEDLKRMQLFVIPVTTEFLMSNNPALQMDFRFAVENNIPILPIMLESGLVSEFNRVCGEIQFLYRNDEDETAIKYEIKLEKYLDEILGNDSLVEKIKAAFDTYVFLSYRKIDRAYADTLMRLIHKNDLCRDIAIWYDEFLVPGENFNNSIKQMIESSELFLLTVTPNVVGKVRDKNGVEQDNYIIRMEYPLAKQSGIPVLPVELVSTDREILSKKYHGIGDCADGKDEKAVLDNVIENLKSIAVLENDSSAEHKFFIGLAYMSGIDVEIDRERGLKLIEEAASDDLLEAAEKLAEIYLRGVGVEYNYDKAGYWFEKSVAIAEKEYIREKGEENFLLWFNSLVKYGNFYSEYGNHILASENYKKAIECYNNCSTNKTKEMKHLVAECYSNLGSSYEKMFSPDRAIGAYDECLRILNELKKDENNVELQSRFFTCYCRLGDVYLSEGDIINAEEKYVQACEMAENQDKNESLQLGNREKALIFGKMGDLFCRKMDIKSAEKYFEKKYEITKDLFEKTKLISDIREYAFSFEKLADLWMEEKAIFDASEFYTDAEKCFEDIYKMTSTLSSKYDLARIYNKIANFYYVYNDEMNREEKMEEEYYNKSYDICVKLIEETELLSVKKELAISIAGKARVASKKEQYEESTNLCKESMCILDAFKNVNSVVAKLEIADGLSKVSNIFMKFGRVREAEELCYRETVIYSELMNANTSYDIRLKYVLSLYNLAIICCAIRDLSKIPGILEEAFNIIEPLLEKTSDERVRKGATSLYILRADCYRETNDAKSAYKNYHLALKILEKLLESNNNGPNNEMVAVVWYKLSFVSGKERKKCLEKSFEIFDELASKYKNEKKYQEGRDVLMAQLNEVE